MLKTDPGLRAAPHGDPLIQDINKKTLIDFTPEDWDRFGAQLDAWLDNMLKENT